MARFPGANACQAHGRLWSVRGQSILACCLTTILPEISLAEAIDAASVTYVRALLAIAPPWSPPDRFAPPHTISDAGLIGGGHVPMPGEVSLAHHGVLFLDELPEFRRHVLEVLRQPLEESLI